MIVGDRAVLAGRKRARVESTGPGGVKAVDDKCCVGEGGDGLGEDCSMSSRHKVKLGEINVAKQTVKSGGVMS